MSGTPTDHSEALQQDSDSQFFLSKRRLDSEFSPQYQRCFKIMREIYNTTFAKTTMEVDILHLLKNHYPPPRHPFIIVAPGCSGKTTVCGSYNSKILDEETVMNLRWPMQEDQYVSHKEEWKEVTTPLVLSCIHQGLPVTLSTTMFYRVFPKGGTIRYVGNIIGVDIGPSQRSERAVRRGHARGIDPAETSEKLRRWESEYKEIVEDYGPIVEYKEFPTYWEILKNLDHLHGIS